MQRGLFKVSNMKEIDNNVIKYIQDSIYLIQKLSEIASEKNDSNEIIDIYGQVIESLNLFSNYITNIIDIGILVKDAEISNIKNETIVLKEYYINYVDGLLNPNEYIVEKYKRLINKQSNLWIDSINQYLGI